MRGEFLKKSRPRILALGSAATLARLKTEASLTQWTLQRVLNIVPVVQKALPRREFDYTLLSSQYALRGLQKWPPTKQWLCIGEATAQALKRKAPELKPKILKPSDRRGIFKFFQGQTHRKKGARVFYPCSSRSDPRLAQKIREMGFRVVVRKVYRTELLKLSRSNRSRLLAGEFDAVLCLSPSSFLALRKSFGISLIRRLSVEFLVLGSTTQQALRAWGIEARRIRG